MFITVYTTHPDLKTAKRISSVLLKKRLIACANFFPITSMYWWEGKIQNDSEKFQEKGEKNRTYAIKRYSSDIIIPKYLEIYRKICEQKNSHST